MLRKTMAIIHVSCLRDSLSSEAQNKQKRKGGLINIHRSGHSAQTIQDYVECQHWEEGHFLLKL